MSEPYLDVLLVDDNALVQQVVERFLGDLGLRVAIAGRADQALALAARQRPHLAIIDLYLPDMDGPELLQALRALPGCARLPAVAVSGLDEAEARATRASFDAYLTKPVDLDVLEATVRRFLDQARTTTS